MEKKKSFWDVFLTPLIIAIVGLLGTFFITRQQIKSAEISMKAQIESSERQAKSAQQVKILEIFSGKITSPNIKEREIAVRILSALDKDLSEKLAKAIVESSDEDTLIRNIATQFIQEKSYVVIGSYTTLETARLADHRCRRVLAGDGPLEEAPGERHVEAGEDPEKRHPDKDPSRVTVDDLMCDRPGVASRDRSSHPRCVSQHDSVREQSR